MAKRKLALWGAWHVHAEKYLSAAAEAGATVVGIWDEDPERRDKIAAKCSLPAFASEEELLASGADGVIVCTATSDHPRVLTKLAEAGKDVFTEKVLATTDEDAEKIAAAVKKTGAA
ncbi:MAG: Gfo/Idh/MocA family oxidoreductase, partial [Clostridia bacterium]|nr:Gfo/Idh/MocA family oxidoreductase [Clostridia bacterium]